MKTEKRKAKIGERILITNPWTHINPNTGELMQMLYNGDILQVCDEDFGKGVGGNIMNRKPHLSGAFYIKHDEYEVIVDEDGE